MLGKLFVVSACSGAGKTTLVTQVVNRLTGHYPISRIVTYTSKNPRAGDVDGRDYYFLSSEEFEKRIKDNFFLEWSKAYGTYYGSPRSIIKELSVGKSFIVITDMQGALSLAEKVTSCVLIWIEVPNQEIIKKRLFQRNSENNEQIHERISISFKENEKYLKNISVFHKVLNDTIEKAVLELESVIIKELKKQ